jgi:hypothetical protein
MTSFQQIEANRRNAQLSSGPITEEGKRKSRQNAVRHGLTAETVIDAFEDAGDYAAFELAVASEYDAQSAVERELVLRLASLLWRLRRATSIETGLFEAQARHSLRFRKRRPAFQDGQHIDDVGSNVPETGRAPWRQRELPPSNHDGSPPSTNENELTQSFIRLNRLPSCPLDRLSRYEATLWRQACQILFTLQCLTRRKPWARINRL